MTNTSGFLSRREFIEVSTASIVLAAGGAGRAEQKPWYATMRRCGQINFNERDPLTMDVDAWVDYWASLKVDAVLLNGGGIVAFYPTQVPYHHRSEFLGRRDLFGEMAAAVKKRGLRVVARMDCNLAYEEALKARPEWFERNRDGSPRRHNESTWLFRTCMFSSYFTEQMPAIYREINRLYPVDGFFTNGWPSTGAPGVCHCGTCQRLYNDLVGGPPPEQIDSRNPRYRKYYEAHMKRVTEIWDLWNSVAREKKSDSVYVGNLGGGIRTVKNLRLLGKAAAWFNADHQGRSGDTPIWDCAQQGRVAQSVMEGRTITNVTGSYSNSRITWRHTAKAPEEATLLIPNAAYLSDAQCAGIREFVAAGGSVLATFETSRYSEWGEPRPDFGLADLFGAESAGEVIGPLGNSYARIERRHKITEGFEGTALLPGAESRVPIRAPEKEPPVLSVVPYYPAFPPEMVFARAPRTDEPAAVFRQAGPSRIAYFAGDIDRSFWRSGNTDLLRLLQNGIHWTHGDGTGPVRVEGEGVVELFAWETEPGYALHILNYTNPNMTKGFIHNYYRIGAQKVAFQAAAGKKISGVRVLRAGRTLGFKQSGAVVEFAVPSVLDYEVVALV